MREAAARMRRAGCSAPPPVADAAGSPPRPSATEEALAQR
eukprot:CAMPEP_0177452164 /NCGR_PEP_ID=MMETSP0369-20130122/10161_1 /TAXON_ID=447022 ORGANISM="Scrippsiella hangoei-like, Strain SHHI-4" /NCGR_SAMPLE_ID=MMETSP0369 /ASSEMBLY_ACC=CAM_ASM_000364 /LENGTH=39 /DNA_ID= /DNA_START= /DNA_END= /DNA_ORIENTATION=